MNPNQLSSSSSSDNENDVRPPNKQPKREWLKHGVVPRSTMRRWEKRAREEAEESSDSSSIDSSDSNSSHESNNVSDTSEDEDTTSSEHEFSDGGSNYDNAVDGEESEDREARGGGGGGGDDDGDGDGDDDGGDIHVEDISDAENFEFMPHTLFRGSAHTAGEAVLQLLKLYERHAMTKSCLKDIIQLIHTLLPVGNTFPSSYHFLQKNISPFIPPNSAVEHVACQTCSFYLGPLSSTPPGPCEVCGELARVKFHEFSLSVLIKYLFEKRGLADAIDAYVERPGSDITESEEYQRIKEEYQGKYDVTLLWNADGVKVRKSGPASLWELSVTICEVAPQIRNKFTLVVGLWYAELKPNLKAFLTPFMVSLLQLERHGVRWTHPRSGEAHVSKVVATATSVDAPVRADLQNILHHGGEFSCHTCEIEGMELALGPRSFKRVYPVPDEPCPLRTKESMREQANRAEAENVIVKGVKGSSLLETIPMCDPVKCIILDYLHLVLLGIVRQFYKLWFTGSGTDWYIGRRKRAVTAYLKNIKRTYEICRCPSDASQWKLFKGSTWRTWCMFVSLPALQPQLKDKYFQHWMLLVIGMSLLLQEAISADDLALADHLLSLFVRDAQELYGYSNMSYNLHCLSHLVLITRRWGAPWAVSAFKFERLNGVLTRLVHGNIRITTELCNTLNLIVSTNTLDYLMNGDVYMQVDRRLSLISPVRAIDLTDDERHALVEALTDLNEVSFFRRAKIAGKIFTSTIYYAERATDNKHVCYELRGQDQYGIIQFYVKKNADLYAVIKKLLIDPDRWFQHTETGIIVNHIIPILTTDLYAVIPVTSISHKVFRIHGYICKELNRYEAAL